LILIYLLFSLFFCFVVVVVVVVVVQISTSNKVYIFDFRKLCAKPNAVRSQSGDSENSGKSGSSGSKSGAGREREVMHTPLMLKTRVFLHNLFTDPTILKVGWSFKEADVRMLKKVSNGT
jgi:hypothetical protein